MQVVMSIAMDGTMARRIEKARGNKSRSEFVRTAVDAWLTQKERRSDNLPQPPEPDLSTLVREEPDT